MFAGRRQRSWLVPVFAVALVGGLVLAVLQAVSRDWLGFAASLLLAYVGGFSLWGQLHPPGARQDRGGD